VDGETEGTPTVGACVARHDHFLSASRGMSYRDSSQFLFLTCKSLIHLTTVMKSCVAAVRGSVDTETISCADSVLELLEPSSATMLQSS
jgi:hypothetical protein